MAQPTPYTREFNFSDQQAETPSDPLPAPHVDAEFNRIKLTTDEILENLSLIQNDSGGLIGNLASLPDGIVTVPTLASDVLALISTGGDLPELEAVADYVIDEIASADTADDGVDSLLSVKDGVIVNSHKPGFHPEDYLGVLTPDAALAACRDAAIAAGGCVIISRPWTIKQKFLVLTDTHIEIMGGASLLAHPTLFEDDVLVEVGEEGGLGGFSGGAEFFSITGAGKLDCGNDIDDGIRVVKGRFGLITIKEIHGANEKAVLVGTAVDTFNSYEIDVRDVRAYYNDVANTATSIAFHANQATDCHFSTCYSIGYRKGFRTENSAIDIDGCHVWGRLAHGPLTHCFDIQGSQNKITNCYADTPHNIKPDGTADGTITDVYGFYIHGFNTTMDGSLIYMNTTLQTDGVVTCIYEDRDTFSDFGRVTIFGGVSGTQRYKKAVPLFGTNTTVDLTRQPGSSYFSGSPAGLSSVKSAPGVNTIEYGTMQFAGAAATFSGMRPVFNLGLTSSAAIRVTGAAGTARSLEFQTGGLDRAKVRINTVAESGANAGSDLIEDMYDDAGAFLLTASTTVRATGDKTFVRDLTLGRDFTFKPSASKTPGTNGQVTFELTSNTSLTVKAKGSDGTVRSVVLTLA